MTVDQHFELLFSFDHLSINLRNISCPKGCLIMPSSKWYERHNSIAHFEPLFSFDHLPINLRNISRPFSELAIVLLESLYDGPELAVALRKLLESKDCAVRQCVIDNGVK